MRRLALIGAGAFCLGLVTEFLGEGQHLPLAALLLIAGVLLVAMAVTESER